MSKFVSLAVSGAVLAVSTGAFGASAALNKNVTLVVDGVKQSFSTTSGTVAEVLKANKIAVGDHDVVAPSINSQVRNGTEVAVLYGRPVDATIDGHKRSLWTTARTVNDFLAQFAIRAEGSKLSTSRSATISREGMALEIEVAKSVAVTKGGQRTPVVVTGTVQDALDAAGVKPGEHDKISPDVSTPLVEGQEIKVVTVEKKQYTKEVALPHGKKDQDDASLAKGTSKVITEGKDGKVIENWEQVLEDGVVVSDTKISDGDKTDPVDQVTAKGTGSTDSNPAKQSTPASTPAQSAPAVPAGGHTAWMAAAGISASDYGYVEQLIARESGWNPNAINSGSGACGLVQALPCSKLGPNWNNPIVALQWANAYVASRYGGWSGAWAHSQATGWY